MSDLREYVKDRLARYPGETCVLHHDLRHWLMEHPPVADDPRAEIEAALRGAQDHLTETFGGHDSPLSFRERSLVEAGVRALLAAHPVQEEGRVVPARAVIEAYRAGSREAKLSAKFPAPAGATVTREAAPCHQGVRGCEVVTEHYHPDEKYARADLGVTVTDTPEETT